MSHFLQQDCLISISFSKINRNGKLFVRSFFRKKFNEYLDIHNSMCTKCTECENYSPDNMCEIKDMGDVRNLRRLRKFPNSIFRKLRIFNVANFRIQFPHFADFAHNFPLLATVRRFRTFPNPFHTLRRCCNLNTYFANSPLKPHIAGSAHFPIHFTGHFADFPISHIRKFPCKPHFAGFAHFEIHFAHSRFFAHFANFPHAGFAHFAIHFTHFAKFVNWQVRPFLHFAYCSIDIFFLQPYI